MKKFLSHISFLLIISLCFMSTIGYAASDVAVSYDPADGVVSLNGDAVGHTTVRTVPYNYDMEAASGGNLYTDFDYIYANGAFTYEFIMPDNAAYGKYAVYVSDGIVDSDGFMYYNTSSADSLIPYLNSRTTAVSLADAISTSAATLGIDKDSDIYIANSASAANILVSGIMPFADSTDFYNDYHGALSLAAMRGANRNTIEGLLVKYEGNLDIDYSDYSALSDGHKSELCSVLSGMDVKSELQFLKQEGKEVSYKNLLKRTIALCAVRLAGNWLDIKKAMLTDYSDVLSYIVTQNSSYKTSMEADVFARLAKTGDFSTVKTLKESFDSAVSYVASQNSGAQAPKPQRPQGGTVSLPSSSVIPGNEYDVPQSGETSDVRTSLSAPVLSEAKSEYSDLQSGDWEYKAVSTLGGNNIISGYTDGSYRPDNMITRAEFTKLIASAFSVSAKEVEFSDVSKDDWFYPYVSVTAGAGIIQGYDGRFNPNANITREDAALIIYRLSSKLGKNYIGSANFGDVNDVSLYALTAVMGLGNAGIVNGDSNMNFNPKNNLTRAEAAQLIYNFIAKLAQ